MEAFNCDEGSATYSGKTADPKCESSSSSMVKPLQFTWRQKREKELEKGARKQVEVQCGNTGGQCYDNQHHPPLCYDASSTVEEKIWRWRLNLAL